MINPVLAEMAVYPFTRLEEERRTLRTILDKVYRSVIADTSPAR